MRLDYMCRPDVNSRQRLQLGPKPVPGFAVSG